MNIQTVELTEFGIFLVNKNLPDQTSVPDNMANRQRVIIQEWMDKGNTPNPYVGPTDLENWVEDMHRSDKILPRYAEDILDGMPN